MSFARWAYCSAIPHVMLVLASLPAAGDVTEPTTWQDDAGLHAVHFVDRAIGWAAGDHGMVLRTMDGGQTWEPRPVPDDLSLRGIFFLTGDVGWAVGGKTTPFTQVETGSVYATDDAGTTWRRINREPVPRLHAVRFFSRAAGIAAGDATPTCPSGVLRTVDGGVTWTPIDAATVVNAAGWRGASFASPDIGVVVGMRGRRAGIGNGQLLASRETAPALRGLNAVTLIDTRQGWAVGDGGTVLQTEDGGLIWSNPKSLLPQVAREVFDFQAVAAVGTNVWIAGRPGSVVWHSSDGGSTWLPQSTGSTLPIHALAFTTDRHGIAVGAMGVILATSDGGTTWRPIRAADRRAGLLCISRTAQGVPFGLVATLGGDQGYRTVVVQPVRQDLGAAEREDANHDLRLHDAVVAAGANAAVTDWPLPLTTPGTSRDADALIAEWNRVTEGDLERVLVGRLVAAIRTWRPSVVVLENPVPGDAAAELLRKASLLAVIHASDATKYVEQRAILMPWSVKKVYLRSAAGGKPDAVIHTDALLPRLQLITADVADSAASRVDAYVATSHVRDEYRLVPHPDRLEAGPFFAGLAIPPGSEARRDVEAPVDTPRTSDFVSRRRTVRAYAEKTFDDPRHAAGMLAQIDEISAGLSAGEASRQLFMLAETHRRNSRWDLAEPMLLALVERYPNEPAAHEAMVWLLNLWTGSEPVWRRMKDVGARHTRSVASADTLQHRIDTAFAMAAQGKSAETVTKAVAAGLGPDPLTIETEQAAIKIDATRRWDNAVVEHWRGQALRLGSLMRQTAPELFTTPDVQFPLAVAVRNGGGSAAAYMQRFAGDAEGGGWSPAASAELTLARTGTTGGVPTIVSQRAVQPPHLDGVFSDQCWQQAKASSLAPDPSARLAEGGLVLISHDEKFLYLAASIPRVPNRPVPVIELAGRTHDAVLTDEDRLVVSIDIDRDYTTSYKLAVDQRGRTYDECWGDATWNPQWYIAVEGDDARWRVEAAIPFSELGPRTPAIGEIWAVSIARVAPAVGVQGWPKANDGTGQPDAFGLLRFE